MKQMYWLIFYPETFIFSEREQVLIFNTKVNSYLLFKPQIKIQSILNGISKIDNLYSIRVYNNQRFDPDVSDFIEKVKDKKIGDIVLDTSKPISLPPRLKINQDFSSLDFKKKKRINGDILKYLNEISLYINGSNYAIKDFYKQIPYPISVCEEMNLDELNSFFCQYKLQIISTINIIGDIFSYSQMSELDIMLQKYNANINIYVLYEDVESQLEKLDLYNKKKYKFVFICNPENDFIYNPVYKYQFWVDSQQAFQVAEEKIKRYHIQEYDILPVFHNNNLDFFNEEVYLSMTDLVQMHISKKDIFRHQVINSNFFGKISLLPDGSIYSNLNLDSIGSIKDNWATILLNSISKDSAWRFVRDSLPCTECVFKFICPSPSNYELVIGKMNLCTIRE